MTEDKFNEYKRTRYKDQLDWYDRKATKNHKLYQIFQWITLILASLTPIIVLIGEDWSKWLAAFIAVLVAISAGALKAFKYQENWINYRTTCEALRKEPHYMEANIEGYNSQMSIEDKYDLFAKRVENLISRENTLWLTTSEKRDN